MKLRRSKEAQPTETTGKEAHEDAPKTTKSKKVVRDEGSRVAGLVLLAVSLLIGIWFYLAGKGGLEGLINNLDEGWMSSTYVFEADTP